MKGVTKIDGVPHIKGIPCVWDRYFNLSSAEYLGLSEWLCPFFFLNLSKQGDEFVCLNDCHESKERTSPLTDL